MNNIPFKFLRIVVLLFILATVWTTTISQQRGLQSWQGTTDIAIIPIAADGDNATHQYLKNLNERDFNSIKKFFKREIKRYRPESQHALNFQLSDAITELPPLPPQSNRNPLRVIWWSLKLRWWTRSNRPSNYHSQQIGLYVLFHKPEANRRLPHSTGLQKGMVGIIHAFATTQQRSHNNLIIAHELLHIFGATDKYDLNTGLAIAPHGFAEPNKQPLYPQRFVEIMGRTIAQTATSHHVADRLSLAIINPHTAREIGLLKSP